MRSKKCCIFFRYANIKFPFYKNPNLADFQIALNAWLVVQTIMRRRLVTFNESSLLRNQEFFFLFFDILFFDIEIPTKLKKIFNNSLILTDFVDIEQGYCAISLKLLGDLPYLFVYGWEIDVIVGKFGHFWWEGYIFEWILFSFSIERTKWMQLWERWWKKFWKEDFLCHEFWKLVVQTFGTTEFESMLCLLNPVTYVLKLNLF